jgi:hypothetical protein
MYTDNGCWRVVDSNVLCCCSSRRNSIKRASDLHSTHLITPRFDASSNLIADFAHAFEALIVCAAERSWIGKAPMQSLDDTREYRTTFCASFIADCDHIWEKFSAFENIKDGLRLLSGDINSDLAHGFDRKRVERARFEASAVRFKIIGTTKIEKSFRHLAACTVVDADE